MAPPHSLSAGGFFISWGQMIYPAKCTKCGEVEVSKPMADDFPVRHTCGGTLTRRYTATPVHFAAGGFYSTDVSHFQKQLGPERYAKFERQRDAAQARAATGTLTPYEKVLESV